MLFLEGHARLVLVLHTLVAGVLVGSATHHAVACGRYLAGHFERARLERLYALVAASTFAVTFLIGVALYPTYKVRVRAEYLDAPDAVAADRAARAEQGRQVALLAVGEAPGPAAARPHGEIADLSWVARGFDVKEHWAALGLFASLAIVVMGRLAHPSKDRRFLLAYAGLSFFVCAAAWIGALFGVITTSFRSVGGLR